MSVPRIDDNIAFRTYIVSEPDNDVIKLNSGLRNIRVTT